MQENEVDVLNYSFEEYQKALQEQKARYYEAKDDVKRVEACIEELFALILDHGIFENKLKCTQG